MKAGRPVIPAGPLPASTAAMLPPSEDEIHHPAAADVRTTAAAVVEDVGVVAPRVLQCIRQDRHPVKGFLLIDAFGERDDAGGEPRRVNSAGAEGVAEDTSDETRPLSKRGHTAADFRLSI